MKPLVPRKTHALFASLSLSLVAACASTPVPAPGASPVVGLGAR